MNVESFLRGFERALQKRANVAAVPGMSSSMPNMPTTTPPTIGVPSLNKKTPMTAGRKGMDKVSAFLAGFEKVASKWQKMFSRLSPASKAKLAHPGTPEGAVTSKEPTKMSPSGEGTVHSAIKAIKNRMWGSYNPAKHERSSQIADLRSSNLRRRLKEQYPVSKKTAKGRAPSTLAMLEEKGPRAGVVLPGKKSKFFKKLERKDPGNALAFKITAPAHEGAEAKAHGPRRSGMNLARRQLN